MAASWIMFKTPSGGVMLFCEESGAVLEPVDGASAPCCHLCVPMHRTRMVVGSIEDFALALSARRMP